MSVNIEAFKTIGEELKKSNVELVAVSKTKPIEDIQALYALGQRNFGENYVQELVDKQTALPSDIQWHFIGHLQTNKVKYIAPFVHLIHGVDSEKLFKNLSSIKEIDSLFGLQNDELETIQKFWKIFYKNPDGYLQNEFLKTWQHLYPVYAEFTSQLLKKGISYEGLAAKMLLHELKLNNKSNCNNLW